jgi:hypothetical protein
MRSAVRRNRLLCAFFLVSVGMVIRYKIQDNVVLKHRLEPRQHQRKPSHGIDGLRYHFIIAPAKAPVGNADESRAVRARSKQSLHGTRRVIPLNEYSPVLFNCLHTDLCGSPVHFPVPPNFLARL